MSEIRTYKYQEILELFDRCVVRKHNETQILCKKCESLVELATDKDNNARWFCYSCKEFRKLHDLLFRRTI